MHRYIDVTLTASFLCNCFPSLIFSVVTFSYLAYYCEINSCISEEHQGPVEMSASKNAKDLVIVSDAAAFLTMIFCRVLVKFFRSVINFVVRFLSGNAGSPIRGGMPAESLRSPGMAAVHRAQAKIGKFQPGGCALWTSSQAVAWQVKETALPRSWCPSTNWNAIYDWKICLS